MKYDIILSWKPFQAKLEGLYGNIRYISFTCPVCGGHNCISTDVIDRYHFLSGNYKCMDCGNDLCNNMKINYYSDCFISTAAVNNLQLSFDF